MRRNVVCSYKQTPIPTLKLEYGWSPVDKAFDPMNPKFNRINCFELRFVGGRYIEGVLVRNSGEEPICKIDLKAISEIQYMEPAPNDIVPIRDFRATVCEFAISHAFVMIANHSGTTKVIPASTSTDVISFEAAVQDAIIYK